MLPQLGYDLWGDEDSDNYGISKQFAHTGAASIEELFQISVEDIEKLKKQQERETLKTGLPSTDYLLSLWVNRFRASRTHILQKSKESVPTSEDIRLFLPAFVKTMRPTGKDKVSYTNTVRGRLDEGVITKEPRRQKQWGTTDVVHESIRCFLQDAIKNGSPSWGYTIMKVLVILL
ncbi:hypothetical protein F5Y07DRAFT_401060 [Xylaria sp. FL0933]|nr:hypothetical protein F5Y07DRAFT_401060 [Xylaria sp. FL0933]